MEFKITLDNFEGPMDLLLHLVKETKLDIYEIKMSEIIDSYINYIHTLKNLNIDISSSFLLMAATLIHLKSKKLIGKTEESIKDEDEFSIESEEELKERIIEYEKYQSITEEFKKLESKRANIYTKIPENLKNYQKEYTLVNEEGLTSLDLLKALEDVIERIHYKEPKNTKITKKEISVAGRKIWIRKKLELNKEIVFDELFEQNTKEYIIATFLAILEMSKEKTITINQENAFTQILIRRAIS